MSDHSNLAGRVVLSPLALLVLGLGAPIAGSFVKDKILTATSQSTTQTQVEDLTKQVVTLNDALKTHLTTDSVHRQEFTQLQDDEKVKVGRTEFETAMKDLDEKCNLILDEIKDIKESSRRR